MIDRNESKETQETQAAIPQALLDHVHVIANLQEAR